MMTYKWVASLAAVCLLLVSCFGIPRTGEQGNTSTQGSADAQSSSNLEEKPERIYLPSMYNVPDGPSTPPLVSTSYYWDTVDLGVAFDYGCRVGTRDKNLPGRQESVVVLDFGAPKLKNGRYGASMMWRVGFAPTSTISDIAYQFGYGYWYCVGEDFESHLRIAVGTNNYTAADSGSVTYEHGRAWGELVNAVNSRFMNECQRGCDGQIDAVGANDFELSWNTPNVTLPWMDGYNSVRQFPLYNFGTLDGCPRFAYPNTLCANGWEAPRGNRDNILKITTGGSVYPLPEIYLIDGVNAQQWYLMSVYAQQRTGKAFDFVGVMTQLEACRQNGGCGATENTPAAGWTQLYNLINNDTRTMDALHFSTDIKWLNEAETPPDLSIAPQELSMSSDEMLVQDLRRTLDSVGLTDEARESLTAKLEMAERMAARSSVDSSGPKEAPTPMMTTASELMLVDEGLTEGSEGILRPWEADVANMWQGVRSGLPMRVFAGASPDMPQQGLVVVIEGLNGVPGRSMRYYPAPEEAGKLRIQSVADQQVALLNEAGGVWYFDLTTREFSK